jgi:hypothetical protein
MIVSNEDTFVLREDIWKLFRRVTKTQYTTIQNKEKKEKDID